MSQSAASPASLGPMPLPVIANTYRVALEWSNSDFPNETATNVIHIRKSGSNAAAIAVIVDAAVTAPMWRFMDTHSKIVFQVVTPLDGGSVSLPVATGGPAKWSGTQTNQQPLFQVSELIKVLTAKRGRSYRGRVFLPWVDEAGVSGNALDGATTALVTAGWVAFLASLTGAGAKMVVASYKNATAEDVVAIGAELDTATVRRRNLRNSLTG
jgi:hypothetical protein